MKERKQAATSKNMGAGLACLQEKGTEVCQIISATLLMLSLLQDKEPGTVTTG